MPPHWSEKFTGVMTMREPSLGLPRSKPGRPKCNLFSNLRANDNPLRSTYLRYVGELSAKFFMRTAVGDTPRTYGIFKFFD